MSEHPHNKDTISSIVRECIGFPDSREGDPVLYYLETDQRDFVNIGLRAQRSSSPYNNAAGTCPLALVGLPLNQEQFKGVLLENTKTYFDNRVALDRLIRSIVTLIVESRGISCWHNVCITGILSKEELCEIADAVIETCPWFFQLTFSETGGTWTHPNSRALVVLLLCREYSDTVDKLVINPGLHFKNSRDFTCYDELGGYRYCDYTDRVISLLNDFGLRPVHYNSDQNNTNPYIHLKRSTAGGKDTGTHRLVIFNEADPGPLYTRELTPLIWERAQGALRRTLNEVLGIEMEEFAEGPTRWGSVRVRLVRLRTIRRPENQNCGLFNDETPYEELLSQFTGRDWGNRPVHHNPAVFEDILAEQRALDAS